MKYRFVFYLYLVIMVLMLLITSLSLGMARLEDKILPIIICGSIFVLAGAGIFKEIYVSKNPDAIITEDETTELKEARENWRLGLLAGAWITGFFSGVWLLGFIIAIPAYVISYMKAHGTKWHVAILYAVVTFVALYVIFELGLKVKLYRGLIFMWLDL